MRDVLIPRLAEHIRQEETFIRSSSLKTITGDDPSRLIMPAGTSSEAVIPTDHDKVMDTSYNSMQVNTPADDLSLLNIPEWLFQQNDVVATDDDQFEDSIYDGIDSIWNHEHVNSLQHYLFGGNI